MTKKIFLLILTMFFSFQNDFKTKILKSLSNQFALTPSLTLQDLYKSFFQDFWGPEHLISNETFVEEYLNEEIQESEIDNNNLPLLEKTGYEGNFIRINLKAIKYDLISKEKLIEFFIESANDKSHEKNFNEWQKKWKKIDEIILRLNLSLINEENDRKKINEMLENNEYVMSHSKVYKQKYKPHYRLIKSDFIKEKFCFEINNNINNNNFDFCVKLINCLFENEEIIKKKLNFFVNKIKENNINNVIKEIDNFNPKEFHNIKKCINKNF